MTKFSANIGLLWRDRSLIEAVHAAHKAGFDAIECQWPYDTDAHLLAETLRQVNLPLLALNTRRGDLAKGQNGLSAVPESSKEAREAIDEALDYAVIAKAGAVHVMAGKAQGHRAQSSFIDNLHYACERAAALNKTILIEPLNPHDAPDYFLSDLDQALAIIKKVGAANLKVMFDCYHIHIIHGHIDAALARSFDQIGHIQFAGPPHRGAPDTGDVDYIRVFSAIAALGYDRPLGAEYHPEGGDTDASLGWLSQMRK